MRTQQEAAPVAERTVALAPGFNLVGWTGDESIGAVEATAAIPGATAIFGFNALTQQFRSYRPEGLAILNTLAEIAPGSAVWVQVAEASTWTQPTPQVAQVLSLESGFNLVVWTGPSGEPVEVAVASLGSALTAAFRYEAATRGFSSYGPGRPAFLNTLAALNYGDGLYVQVSRAVTWEQPASGVGEQPPDGEEEPAPAPMQVTSSAFGDNQRIPVRYTCDGVNVSPPITLTDIPAETVSLVLITDDPDAPGETWIHWVEFNIAPQAEISEGAAGLGRQGINSFGTLGYGGPCPPFGETHRYFFKVSALDTTLTLAEGATKAQLLTAMAGQILQEATLIGLYSR